MNILLTVPNYFLYSFGGIQTYVHCLAKELSYRGHQVAVLTAMPRQDGDEPFVTKKYLHNNITIIAYSINADHADVEERYCGWGPLRRQLLMSVLAECHPDLIHINERDPVITSLCNEMHIPHVVTVHAAAMVCPKADLLSAGSMVCRKTMNPQDCIACYLSRYPWYSGGFVAKIPGFLYRWYGSKLGKRKNLPYLARGLFCPWLVEQDILAKRGILNQAQCIIAPSLFIRDLLARNGCDSRKIQVIGHGVEPIEGSPVEDIAKRPVRFAYIGRVSKGKGLHILLESAGLLPDDSACEIHIFGDAPDYGGRDYLKQILSGYRAGAAVFTHGVISHDRLNEVFAMTDVLVVPSVIPEAFGLVVQEAFSAGRPVIVANSGGLAELVRDGVDGFVVEHNDALSLSRAMQRIIAEPDLIREMTRDLPHVKTGCEYANEMEILYRGVA